MSVVGAAVILGVIVAVLLKMKVARPSVVIVCVLFGLVLGVTPIGDGLNETLASLGGWTSRQMQEL